MEILHHSIYNSPVGPLRLAVSQQGLLLLQFANHLFPPKGRMFADASWEPLEAATAPYVAELGEYFSGRRRQFSFPIDLWGTSFQKRCWQALLAIPYGEVRSYAEMARAVGCPRGFRAVGLANHDNPVAIVVPCHRVIASDGTLGGYGGGLPLKKYLLELEGVHLSARVAAEFQEPLFRVNPAAS